MSLPRVSYSAISSSLTTERHSRGRRPAQRTRTPHEFIRSRLRRSTSGRIEAAGRELEHTRARVVALSPQATLDRGYAVVQTADGAVVRDPADVALGERLRLRVAGGELGATAG